MSRCVPTIECSDPACYLVEYGTCGECGEQFHHNRNANTGERIHHHEETPAPT